MVITSSKKTKSNKQSFKVVLLWYLKWEGSPKGNVYMADSFCYAVEARGGFPGTSLGKESSCNAEDPSSIPGSGRSPGEGIGYSC